MSPSPLHVYDAALESPAGTTCVLRTRGGLARSLPLHRWTGPADIVDRTVASWCDGPTLDVGCGPGRLAASVAECGHPVLGIDISLAAVRLTQGRGVAALRRSVFDPLPGEGRWTVLLLIDGNIGIGGDPVVLLRRAAGMLAPTGRLVCEVEPPSAATQRAHVRLELDGQASEWFPWSWVGADDIRRLGEQAGLLTTRVSEKGGRWFAVLAPA